MSGLSERGTRPGDPPPTTTIEPPRNREAARHPPTGRTTAGKGVRARGPWAVFFRLAYRAIRSLDPLIRIWWRRFGLADTVELVVAGRRSGRPRAVLVGLLVVDGAWYVGHPSGDANWTRNLRAAKSGVVVDDRGRPTTVRARLLEAGPERTAAIAATWRQHPLAARPIYRAARSHILRWGVYFRLEPEPAATAADLLPTRLDPFRRVPADPAGAAPLADPQPESGAPSRPGRPEPASHARLCEPARRTDQIAPTSDLHQESTR